MHVDASTGQLDLQGLSVAPGEVVEFVLDGSGGSEHAFVLTGLAGAAIDQRLARNGDTVVRVRAPRAASSRASARSPATTGCTAASSSASRTEPAAGIDGRRYAAAGFRPTSRPR